MDRLHLIKGLTMMIIIAHVTSQHFPPSQHPFVHFSLPDDDYNNNRDWNFFFESFQRPKQKPIKSTGNILTPVKITFDTNSALLPQMINRLQAQNIYWYLTRQQLQQQQQQQEHQNYVNHHSYQQSTSLRPRKSRSIGRFMQSQQRHPMNGQSKGNTLTFDDMLQPRTEEATILDDEVQKYQNAKEPLLPTARQMKQFLLWWNVANTNARQNILRKNINNFITRNRQQLNDDDVILQMLLPTKRKRIPSKLEFAFEPDGQLDYDDDNDNDKSFLDEVDYPLALPLFMPMTLEQMPSDDAFLKRNAFRNHKRQKMRPPQERFMPSISAGAMTNLGHFFKDLKSNVKFMEKQGLSPGKEKLLEGDHPINMLHDELMHSGAGSPTDGTAAFLHAIRTYRPSQKIRSLVALNPEGYHGSQFLDPNYMWVGLGK